MIRKLWMALAITGMVLAVPTYAIAWTPAGGAVNLGYWLGEMDFSGETDDMDGYGVEADLWLTPRLCVSLDYYPTNGGGVFRQLDTNYVALDLKWKVLSPNERTALSVGIGWQSTSLTIPGDRISTKGPRLLVEGEVGLRGGLRGYAGYVYLPDLDDLDEAVTNGDGVEYALGLKLDVRFFDVYAGYRVHDISFEFSGIGPTTIEIDNAGFVAGIGWTF